MRLRRALISVGVVLGVMAAGLFGIVALVKREPDFYVRAEMAPGQTRKDLSKQAESLYWRILPMMEEPGWETPLSADQINAFFQEDYYNVGGDENLPAGVHAPRVAIDDGKLRLGFRYGSGLFSTVVSLEIRLWKVPEEPTTLAMEIVSMRAGRLPISPSTLLDKISAAARRESIDITWYRQNGHPVAVMRFQADLNRPTFQIDRVDLNDGVVAIRGRSTDPFAPPTPRVVSKP